MLPSFILSDDLLDKLAKYPDQLRSMSDIARLGCWVFLEDYGDSLLHALADGYAEINQFNSVHATRKKARRAAGDECSKSDGEGTAEDQVKMREMFAIITNGVKDLRVSNRTLSKAFSSMPPKKVYQISLCN